MSKNSAVLCKKNTVQLKVKGYKGKLSWGTTNKKVVSVSKSGKIWSKTGGISGFCRGGRHNFSLQFCQGLCILTSLVVNCGGNIHICGGCSHGFPPGTIFFGRRRTHDRSVCTHDRRQGAPLYSCRAAEGAGPDVPHHRGAGPLPVGVLRRELGGVYGQAEGAVLQ